MSTISADKRNQLDAMFSAAARPVILTHQHPDGDAIGSCIALKLFLREFYGKDAEIIVPNDPPLSLGFLLEETPVTVMSRERRKAVSAIEASDLLICLDCSSLERTGEARDIALRHDIPRLLVDHHLNPREDEFTLVFSRIDISSASEFLYLILKDLSGKRPIPLEALKAIMTGLTTDTNNFANSVFPTTFTTASELIAAGVDRDEILLHLYNEYRENRVRLFSFLLLKKMVITPQGVAYIFLNRHIIRKYDVREGDTEGLVNIPLTIGCVRMSIFLKEETDLIRVSIRSKKGTSANSMAMTYFNGGGHENAAGGRLVRHRHLASYREITDYVERACKEFFKDESK